MPVQQLTLESLKDLDLGKAVLAQGLSLALKAQNPPRDES
jgi:hypothetical protein